MNPEGDSLRIRSPVVSAMNTFPLKSSAIATLPGPDNPDGPAIVVIVPATDDAVAAALPPGIGIAGNPVTNTELASPLAPAPVRALSGF